MDINFFDYKMHFFCKENFNFQLILYEEKKMSEEDYYRKMLALQTEENLSQKAAASQHTVRSTAANARCN